jgi:hypothetical protein
MEKVIPVVAADMSPIAPEPDDTTVAAAPRTTGEPQLTIR